MRTEKIIIVEGIDRIGKTTALIGFCQRLEINDYTVIPIGFKLPNSRQPEVIDDIKTMFTMQPELFDISAIRSNQMMWDFMKMFDATKTINNHGTIIVVDRMYLSNFIYGLILRKESFEKFWGSNGSKLIRFNEAIETQLQKIAETTMITFVKSKNDIFEDDNEHEVVKITANQQIIVNELFRKLHDSSLIKDKYLVEVTKTNNWYNTLDSLILHTTILSK